MRVLITGASGLIGSALLDQVKRAGHSVICQSRFYHEDQLNVRWIEQDLIKDSWDGISLPHIDVIYHLASQTSTYRARQCPIDDMSANVLGLLYLLEHFKKQDPPPFVVIAGTATEVGLVEKLPINESVPDNPITFYDISKLSAEMYLKQYIREGWVNGCALRLANVFGHCKAGQEADRGVIDKIFSRAIAGQDITIYGHGNYIRDYIFVDDVISALILAAEHREKTNGRNFYIGSGQGITLKEAFLKVISMVTAATGISSEYMHVTPPAGFSDIEFRNAIIDFSAFKQATGWSPLHDFDAGLAAAYSGILSELS